MKTRLTKFILMLFMFVVSASSYAQPITYQFSGIADGSLKHQNFDANGDLFLTEQQFSDISFDVIINTDTDLINGTTFGPDTPSISGIFDDFILLDSIGVYRFNSSLYVFNNQDLGIAGFGRDLLFDLLNIEDSSLTAYDLSTDFGPVFDPAPYFDFTDIGLTGRNSLTFTSVSDASFQAYTSVPAPSTFLLVGLGLGMIGFIRKVRSV